jgi:HAD superfamily hydrolase (TIGR01549 family)
VPVLDLVLPQPPAEIDVLAATPCGEIDESLIGVLDQRSQAVDRVHAAGERLQFVRNPLVELDRHTRIDPAAVAGNLGSEATSRVACLGERAPMLDQLLRERPDLAEQRVRFLEREDAFGHVVMIENDVAAGQRLNLADLDAVTLDAYGTLLELDDPVGSLAAIVPGFDRAAVERAFLEEAAYYTEHAHEGRDARTLKQLRARCAEVFNRALGSNVTPEQFTGALRFAFLPSVLDAVAALRRRGLEVAVVSNWDVALHDHLAPLDVLVVTSADAGVAKPDPTPLLLALEQLRVEPTRTLHIGDSDADGASAAAAGAAFVPAPLPEAVAQWT